MLNKIQTIRKSHNVYFHWRYTLTFKSRVYIYLQFLSWDLRAHNLIFLPNKIRLNLINTFVMSRNKHISKKTRCFSRKRSKNKAKPNEFERCILKLSCYACSDNPICRHAFSMFRNVSRMNSDLRCITETSSATLQ